jgi:hypothetical protein
MTRREPASDSTRPASTDVKASSNSGENKFSKRGFRRAKVAPLGSVEILPTSGAGSGRSALPDKAPPLCRFLMNSESMPQVKGEGGIGAQHAQADREFKILSVRYNAPENFRTNSSPLKCRRDEQFIEP